MAEPTEFPTPLSRVEAILENILGDDNEIVRPLSRGEALLIAILNMLQGEKETIEKKADIIHSSASGSVVSIADGAENTKMDSVVVDINPVQHLHGYDNPWPAGGGKNKLVPDVYGGSLTWNDVTISVQNGELYLNGTAGESGGRTSLVTEPFELPAGSYIISCDTTQFVLHDASDNIVADTLGTETFTLNEATTVYAGFNVIQNTQYSGVLKAQIESGSTATSYAPYSNICPISGWTGAKVTRCRKNLMPNVKRAVNVANVMIGQTPTYTQGWEIHLAPGTYILSTVTTKTCYLFYRNADGTVSGNSSAGKNPTMLVTVAAEDDFAFWANNSGGIVPDDIVSFQLESGSVATEYEPYQRDTFNITFPSEAGTVYGGTLDVTTGVLTVTDISIASYDGETFPGEWISDRDVYASGVSPTTGAQVVYKLATPQTYQLTPTEITTLLGINNIWADTGDVSVDYIADTKLYIDNKISEIS